jgi:flagellar biosynthetic protein FlhB
MAAADAFQERTEQPTPRRREEARRRGQVPRSADLTAAAALLAALGVHVLAGGWMAARSVQVLRRGLARMPEAHLTLSAAHGLLVEAASTLLTLAGPALAAPALAAVAVQLAQTGFAPSWRAARPAWERLSPRAGLARLLGGGTLAETAKVTLKLAALGAAAALSLQAAWPALLALGGGAPALLSGTGRAAADLWLAAGLAALALGGLDWGHQWWRHQRSLRMTRQELREDLRETEGDPVQRSRRRALHRQHAARRMMAEVRRADVVVRNPVHLAVALRYDRARMRAPRVVAKGRRLLAHRIVAVARRHGVAVVENPPLARTLFRLVAVGQEIPRDLYRAVAEVLAHVYRLRAGNR